MDKKDFENFYNKNFEKIYRFVFFRVAYDKELAADLVSEIFMKALENFASYDPKKSESAWIFTIAKNHLVNYWRDFKTTESLSAHFEPEENGNGDSSLLTLSLEKYRKNSDKAEAKNRVNWILDELEPPEREIVTFHYLFGYSYAEVGKITGMSAGAVKVAAHRALKKLRKMYEP